MTLNHIETSKTSVFSSEHTSNTNIYFDFLKMFNNFKNPFFFKVPGSKHHRFMLILMALFIFNVGGHIAELVPSDSFCIIGVIKTMVSYI